jgi:hypothetical protein
MRKRTRRRNFRSVNTTSSMRIGAAPEGVNHDACSGPRAANDDSFHPTQGLGATNPIRRRIPPLEGSAGEAPLFARRRTAESGHNATKIRTESHPHG